MDATFEAANSISIVDSQWTAFAIFAHPWLQKVTQNISSFIAPGGIYMSTSVSESAT